MKLQRLNPIVLIIGLVIVGFLAGAYFPRVWDLFFAPARPVFTVWESVFSLILLLLVCLLCARIMLGVYSKIQKPRHPILVLGLAFLILVATPLLRIWFGLQQYQLLLKNLPDQFAGTSVSTRYINFFTEGLEIVLLTGGIICITLLWVVRARERKALATYGVIERRQDIVLLISTLVILFIAISRMVQFITMEVLFWVIGQGWTGY